MSSSLNGSIDTAFGTIVTDQQLFSQRLDEFKGFRSLFLKSFIASGLQPSTSIQVGSDEDNLNAKRQAYRWLLRPDFVPQVDAGVMSVHGTLVPKEEILDDDRLKLLQSFSTPDAAALAPGATVSSMEEIENLNRTLHFDTSNVKGDFYDAPNIGLREDWFTDAVFAQQQFTGVNPTTISILSDSDHEILDHFIAAAEAQCYTEVATLITSFYTTEKLYIQDCSYFRNAAGLQPDEDIKSDVDPRTNTYRYGCASMVLFSLDSVGKLHPLAITLDYKHTEASRVTIFNKRLTPSNTTHDEKTDWPWRYAKMCAQVSDWSRHEMTVHLTDTHLIEETIIVAAQRNFPDSHIILQILNSHWKTTLSLNALAHDLLVPGMIYPVAPFSLPQVKTFIGHARAEFDFEGRYVPTDLEKRGFPVCELENPTGKFHNYTYARQVYKMWCVTRKFVASILSKSYANDAAVAADAHLSGFITEIRAGDGKTIEGGFLPKFPVVNTLEGLIDMVTMCIHIAAPQHTAVNYLQQFYLAFIPNRPGSLYTPLPNSLADLERITERDVLTALPLNNPTNWLMMAGVPYLLSEEVEMEDNIVSYAKEAANHANGVIAEAGKVLRQDINELVYIFKESSLQNDDKKTEYKVLYPDLMASAIII